MARISGNMSRPVPFTTRRFRNLVLQSPSFDLFVYGDELKAMAELINQVVASGILTAYSVSGSDDSGQEIGARLVTIGIPAAVDTTSVHATIADTVGRATLALSGLTSAHMTTVVEALVAGVAGNLVSLRGLADNLPAQKAKLDLATKTTHWNTKVRAKTAGAAGNAETVALVVDGSQAVKASLDLATKTTHCNTVIQAKVAGAGGNTFTIAFVADGSGVGSLTLSGSDYTFHYQTTVTTNANFETLITASANLEVKTPGTPGTALVAVVDAFSATHLAGGADATAASAIEAGGLTTFHATDGVTTVTQLEALLPTATNLELDVAGTGANIITSADAFAATHLAGGAATQGATVTEVGPAVTLHWVPSETTVATAETTLGLSTQLAVKSTGVGGTVLLSGDAFAATPLAGGGSNTVTTGFTNPDLPRNVSVAFGAAWDGGNLTIAGLDQFGAPVSEVIVANPGATVNGSQVFATVTSAQLASSGSATGTASIGVGTKLGIPFNLTNTSAVVYVDGATEVAVAVDIHKNSFTPTTAPNASHNYQVQVNVSA